MTADRSRGAVLITGASTGLTPVILDVTDPISIATALADVGADPEGQGLGGSGQHRLRDRLLTRARRRLRRTKR